jgi:Ca2+-transporting ATPase
MARIVFGWPLPILPVQILWNNFIEDTLPTISYAFEPAEKDVMKRKAEPKNISLLTKKIKMLIFFTGIIKQFIILFLFWIFWSVAGWELDYVRTLMFGAFALDTALVVFSFKNLNKNIWQINPFSNKWLNLSSLFAVVAFVSTIYVPFLRGLMKTVPLDLKGWLILIGVALTSVSLVELTKLFFNLKSKNN